jgi:hypothetical protein
MSDTDLRNADLSNIEVSEMTAEQHAELRRRYEDFIRHVVRAAPKQAPPQQSPRRVQRWQPGKRPH